MADRRFADRRRTAVGANGDGVPEAAPVLRRADNGAETQGVQGGRSLPLPDRDVQRRVGWLRTGNDGVDAPSRRHRDVPRWY